MKVWYRKNNIKYIGKDYRYLIHTLTWCCHNMRDAYTDRVIRDCTPDGGYKLSVRHYDEELCVEYIEYSLEYCPFCGEKIEYIEGDVNI